MRGENLCEPVRHRLRRIQAHAVGMPVWTEADEQIPGAIAGRVGVRGWGDKVMPVRGTLGALKVGDQAEGGSRVDERCQCFQIHEFPSVVDLLVESIARGNLARIFILGFE